MIIFQNGWLDLAIYLLLIAISFIGVLWFGRRTNKLGELWRPLLCFVVFAAICASGLRSNVCRGEAQARWLNVDAVMMTNSIIAAGDHGQDHLLVQIDGDGYLTSIPFTAEVANSLLTYGDLRMGMRVRVRFKVYCNGDRQDFRILPKEP